MGQRRVGRQKRHDVRDALCDVRDALRDAHDVRWPSCKMADICGTPVILAHDNLENYDYYKLKSVFLQLLS